MYNINDVVYLRHKTDLFATYASIEYNCIARKNMDEFMLLKELQD